MRRLDLVEDQRRNGESQDHAAPARVEQAARGRGPPGSRRRPVPACSPGLCPKLGGCLDVLHRLRKEVSGVTEVNWQDRNAS